MREFEVLEEARNALEAAGDRAGAGEASALLAEAAWHRGQAQEARDHVRRAEALVRDEPPSRAKARVLCELARSLMLAGEREDCRRIAESAIAMADALGLAELHAHALDTLGASKRDASSIHDLERSIELALSVNSPEAARGYNNLGAVLFERGEVRRSKRYFEQAVRIAVELGNAPAGRHSSIVLDGFYWFEGQWDESLRAMDEVVARHDAGEPQYMDIARRGERAMIRVARGDAAGALADTELMLGAVRDARDPQAVVPQLARAVWVYAQLDRTDEARTVAGELKPWLENDDVIERVAFLGDFADVAHIVGLENDARRTVTAAPAMPWRDALLATLDGDFVRAAETYERMGMPTYAAFQSLRAGETFAAEGRQAEADAQLHKAIAFFRCARAPTFEARAESLLAATA